MISKFTRNSDSMSFRGSRKYDRPMSMKEPTLSPSCSPRSSVSDSLVFQELDDNYQVISSLGSGTYGRVILARCRKTRTRVALKVLPKSNNKLRDFLREFNYSYYLSPHTAIVKTYDVSFETPTSYVFAQEYAPMGDLFEAISPQIGLPEYQVKNMAQQISSAIEFMHSKNLVHRDIKPENILVYDIDLKYVKLMDFGMTKKEGTMVRKVSAGIPYTPPEICEALKGERYLVDRGADVWGFGVLIFCALTGNFPWELAYQRDSFYAEFSFWQRRGTTKTPSQWRLFSQRLLRFFRRAMEPRPDARAPVTEVTKFLSEPWMALPRSSTGGNSNLSQSDDSDSNHMAELNSLLEKQGIETKVPKKYQRERVRSWVLTTSQ